MTVVALGVLGKLVNGVVRGDASLDIRHALPLETTLPANCITLVDNPKQVSKLDSCNAVAAVVKSGCQCPIASIEVADPHAAFQAIVQHLRPARQFTGIGISPSALVDPTAKIGPGAYVAPGSSIGPGCVIGSGAVIHQGVQIMADVVIGDQCTLYPNVVLYPQTIIGNRCTVHAGTVLGANGFGYRTVGGKHYPAAQLGWVELADDVELGACVTIDRGTYGPTRIGEGTKIDNLVMIGHNCQVGKHNLICGQVGIAGSSSTGDYVVLAGQVGIKDHTHLHDKVVVAAQGGVMRDLEEGVWAGSPTLPLKQHMQQVALSSKLPELREEMRLLQREVAALREQLAQQSNSQNNSATCATEQQRAA